MKEAKEEDKIFAQGYISCLCNVINATRGCDADVREAWKALGYSWGDLNKLNLDEYDRKTLSKYKREILKTPGR